MFHQISYQNILESTGKLRLVVKLFLGNNSTHIVNESVQLISLHFIYERPKQGIGSKIASINEKIMKLELQIVMLQSELIQVNFD